MNSLNHPLRFQMPSLSYAAVPLIICVGSLLAEDSSQSWTNTSGTTIKAQFVRLQDETVVIRKDGREFTIPIATLAPASQEQARAFTPLGHVPPTVIGSGAESRIGFPTPESPVFRESRPTLFVSSSTANSSTLAISRLFHCREDTVSTGPNSARMREVGLWTPIPDGPFTQLTPTGKPGPSGVRSLLPNRDLPDGIYCLHTGSLSNTDPAPSYCATFIIRGYGIPNVKETLVTKENNKVLLKLVVHNEGKGEFGDGFVVVTLQKVATNRSEFKGRQHVTIPPVPAGGDVTVQSEWNSVTWDEGDYHFYGHVNYKYLWDANALCSFKSDNFEVPKSTRSAK